MILFLLLLPFSFPNLLSDRTWSSFGCASLCLRDYDFHYKIGEVPLACAYTGFALEVCIADPLWLECVDISSLFSPVLSSFMTCVLMPIT